MKFAELSLNESLLEAIDYMGFETATPVQELAIPVVLDGKDLIACAQTGTGKTAAFLLPVINLLVERDLHGTKVLILVPTRELAIQIDQHVQALAYFAGLQSIAIYGGGDGADWEQQKKALSKGADIIVATPGKLISHLDQGYVNFKTIEYLILDEADRMLDIGFQEDLIKIINHVPKKRQSLLFSATMPKRIRDFAARILTNPEEINLKTSKPAEGVLQAAYLVSDSQKIPLIKSLISDKPNYKSILIFSTTKKGVREIVSSLRNQKYKVTGISSDLEQKERERVLQEYKARTIRVLVATDVLSRGIDIKDIDLVINYNVPGDAEDYVHRVGRTARAETSGVALTLVNRKEMGSFKDIEAFIEREIPKLNPPPGMQPDNRQRPPQRKRPYRGKRRN